MSTGQGTVVCPLEQICVHKFVPISKEAFKTRTNICVCFSFCAGFLSYQSHIGGIGHRPVPGCKICHPTSRHPRLLEEKSAREKYIHIFKRLLPNLEITVNGHFFFAENITDKKLNALIL